jgi:hypothetical protein
VQVQRRLRERPPASDGVEVAQLTKLHSAAIYLVSFSVSTLLRFARWIVPWHREPMTSFLPAPRVALRR